MTTTKTLASASLASVSSLVLLQLGTRGVTFILNQALVRITSPQIFGTASIQFELLLSSILFLSREGVRNALLRIGTKNLSDRDKQHLTSIENIALLPIFAGGPIALLAGFLYLYYSTPTTKSQAFFPSSVKIYALAAFLELLSEPFYVKAQNELRYELRVRAEGAGVIIKSCITFLVLVVFDSEFGLIAFALGQLAYSLVVLGIYMKDAGSAVFRTFNLRKSKEGTGYFEPELLNLSIAMTKQSLVKHVLTEGDKFMVSRICPLEDQGGYALAANYGSLVARIIFQPIEETSRVFFSKTLTPVLGSKNGNASKSRDPISTAKNALRSLLFLQVHFALFVITFGPPYLPTLLKHFLPRRYLSTSAPLIMGAYLYYIPAMALNGVLEAFVSSVATPTDLAQQSRWMGIFSFLYIFSGWMLAVSLGLADVGLVWANVLNSLARALYCWVFIKRWFRQREDAFDWRQLLPPAPVFATLAVAGAITRLSASKLAALNSGFLQDAKHVSIGAICFLVSCLVCFIFEKSAFKAILEFNSDRKKSS